jgi:hypothetical protein
MQKFDMERFNLKKLDEVEGKEQYRVEISNRFAALENFNDDVDINRAWGTIRDNIKISAKVSLGYYKLKKHKPWFEEGCPKLLDQRKQAKFQWLQDLYGTAGKITCFYILIFKILERTKCSELKGGKHSLDVFCS